MRIRRMLLLAILCIYQGAWLAELGTSVIAEQREKAAMYLLQGMNILLNKNKKVSDVPVMWCKKCKKQFLSFGTVSVLVTARPFRDFQAGKNTFAALEPTVKECIGLLTNDGTPEQTTAFVLRVTKELGFPCSVCKKPYWEVLQ